MRTDSKDTYQKIKNKSDSLYKEEIHCPMVIEIMGDPSKSTVAAFCVLAGIGESTFYQWTRKHDVFADCYEFAKALAKFNWEQEAKELEQLESKEVGCKYELWRLKGWSQFGIGKNSRIRVNLTKDGTPAQHYHDILKDAAEGAYTAGEIKQLMEAVNVGLSAHQAFELQKQIDQLKCDLVKVEARNG